jgi:maltooligosyltrehalose trehalohydrolase
VHFLEQLAAEVEQLQAQLGRHLVLIAESDLNDPRLVRPRAVGGYGLDAQWSDDFHHALHAVLTGERSGYYADFGRMAEVAQAFGSGFVYDGRFSAHRGRRHGRPASGLSGRHLVVCLQNHDQVGNRARGERLAQLLGPERLKLAAALLLCAPGIPLLFQGEEWGCASPFLYFTDHQDPELGRAVSQGRRREFAAFGWDPEQVPDPQAPQSFERSRLDWSEREREPHAGLLAWHRALLDLRRRTPELSDGCMERLCTRFDEDTRWIRVDRGAVAIIANLGERLLRLPFERVPHRLLASSPRVRVCGDAVELPPDGAGIFRTDRA